MLLSTVILPVYGWEEACPIWQRAEELGFHAAYTYDHLAYEGFQRGPWFGAVPTLTAAATATERLRLGTLITSANFRHPVTLAKDVMTIDSVSGGRVTVGIGAGSSGLDAAVLGRPPWSGAERASRFEEFVDLLDRLLTHDVTTYDGQHFSAHEAPMLPGCAQRPRAPFAVAGRDPSELNRVYLTGYTAEDPLRSVEAFTDVVGRYEALGITELVVHWPVPGSVFDHDRAMFEAIAAHHAGL